MWPAGLSLGLTAGLALGLGTIGYFMVGFGLLTDCTNAYDCTETTCLPCRPAQTWLSVGAAGQGGLLLTAIALLVVAAVRPATRRSLAVVGWVTLGLAVMWIITSTIVASGSY